MSSRLNCLAFASIAIALAAASNAAIGASADEPTPEAKALITKLCEDMKSKNATTREGAYKSMGDLGVKAKGARRTLCEGMLDPIVKVRTAAADSLKKVDERIYKLALGIVINKEKADVVAAGKIGTDAEPLIPILLKYGTSYAAEASKATADGSASSKRIAECVTSMVAIASDDEGVNRVVIAMLGNPNSELRGEALKHIAAIKNKKTALAAVLSIASNVKDTGVNRNRAVLLVPDLVDEASLPNAYKTLEALRFDNAVSVREAVESAMKKLK